MTDLEITKACAEAMGCVIQAVDGHKVWISDRWQTSRVDWAEYDPLHDDAQCMALVKRMSLDITWLGLKWLVSWFGEHKKYNATDKDLNRAVCSCVAQMQAAKVTA